LGEGERRLGAVIKAVLFDLDGTLYDRDVLAVALFDEQYATFASELPGISRERFLRDVHAMDDHGHGSKESGYPAVVQSWGLDAGLAERLLAHFWANFDRHCKPDPDARSTLDELRRRGLKLGVITNGPSEMQRHKLALLGLEHEFDAVVVSGEEGVRKPDEEIFRRALARCGVAAHEALFVGDHPVADIAGAHGAGLRAIWRFVPYWPPVIDNVPKIRALSELLTLAPSGRANE
jgi:putative hydrolase of the HAD superfamily